MSYVFIFPEPSTARVDCDNPARSLSFFWRGPVRAERCSIICPQTIAAASVCVAVHVVVVCTKCVLDAFSCPFCWYVCTRNVDGRVTVLITLEQSIVSMRHQQPGNRRSAHSAVVRAEGDEWVVRGEIKEERLLESNVVAQCVCPHPQPLLNPANPSPLVWVQHCHHPQRMTASINQRARLDTVLFLLCVPFS